MSKTKILSLINDFLEKNKEEQKLTLLINNIFSVKFTDVNATVDAFDANSMTKAYRIIYDIEIDTYDNLKQSFKIESFLVLSYSRNATYLSPSFHTYREKSIYHKTSNHYYLVDNNYALATTKELVHTIEFLNTYIDNFRELNVEENAVTNFVSWTV